MSICNKFKTFDNAENTIFYTFSEYSNDMVEKQHYVDSSTKIRKFIEPSGFITLKFVNGVPANINEILQYNYENRVCIARDNAQNSTEYKKHLLTLLYNVLNKASGEVDSIEKDNFCYKDIDVVADSVTDGMKYDEILCYLNGTDKASYSWNIDNTNDLYLFKNNVREVAGQEHVYPVGYEDDTSIYTDNYKDDLKVGVSNLVENNVSGKNFDFDIIIVLYDYNDEIKNIPLGIYLTRTPITKVVSDKTIYGQGTSYALRICTRYACTTGTVHSDVTDITADFDRTMETIDRMSKTIDTMNIMTSKFNDLYDIVRRSIYSHGGSIGSGGGSGSTDWYVWNVSE